MRNYAFPFSRKFYPNGLNIHQDNSHIHHSHKAKTIVENIKGIVWFQLKISQRFYSLYILLARKITAVEYLVIEADPKFGE
jgi:hypothetical protein